MVRYLLFDQGVMMSMILMIPVKGANIRRQVDVKPNAQEGAMINEKSNVFQGEVDRNYSAFKEILPNIIEEFQCKFALMQGGKIEDYFDTVSDAVKAGTRQHPDGIFFCSRSNQQGN